MPVQLVPCVVAIAIVGVAGLVTVTVTALEVTTVGCAQLALDVS